jgi:hypothetical protein
MRIFQVCGESNADRKPAARSYKSELQNQSILFPDLIFGVVSWLDKECAGIRSVTVNVGSQTVLIGHIQGLEKNVAH